MTKDPTDPGVAPTPAGPEPEPEQHSWGPAQEVPRQEPPSSASETADDQAGKRKRVGRITVLAAGGVLVVAGIAYLVGYFMAGEKLPRDATVAGISIGGLTSAAATERLQAELAVAAAAPIKVVAGTQPAVAVSPAQAGLSIDYPATISQAGGGRSLAPGHIWQVLTGGSETEPVVAVDQAKLAQAVAVVAANLDHPATAAKVSVDGTKVRLRPATDGVQIDQEQAADAIRQAYPNDDVGASGVELPAKVTEPEVTTAEAAQAVQAVVKPALAGPVKVTAGSAGTIRITPEMIGAALKFTVVDGALKPELDPAKLRAAAKVALAKVELAEPRDATVRLVHGKPKVIPAVDGTTVTAANLSAAVEPVLTKVGAERRAKVELTGAKASFSTAEAKALGIKQVTGKFTTYFPYAYYRNVNISRAAQRINNTVLQPGEVFSLNGVVGERTAKNGFVEGYIIKGGKFSKELGGGVSQSATTTFNAMFFAGLKDIEHQPHTLYIDRYPPGREATVAWPGLDLRFQNNTKYGVLVQAYVKKASYASKGSITVKMWSTKSYDKISSSALKKSNFTSGRDRTDTSPGCEPQYPVPGFDVNYSRIFSNDGKVVKTEKFHWRYAPTDRIVCKKPEPKKKPKDKE